MPKKDSEKLTNRIDISFIMQQMSGFANSNDVFFSSCIDDDTSNDGILAIVNKIHK